MKIFVTSIFVEDQQKALEFYTQKLRFQLKNDVSLGEYRWLTVVSPEDPNGTELLLEPNANLSARAYQQSLLVQDIPAAMFLVQDIQAEYERLRGLGVVFTLAPVAAGPQMIARFEDTCGNLIQICQPPQETSR